MREILFRGRRKFNGEWVEGSLVHIGDFCAIIEHNQDKLHHLDQMYLDADTGNMDGYATKVPFDTVGQFTGLYDKNGKKIFEGDIVQFNYLRMKPDWVGIVTYDILIGSYILIGIYKDDGIRWELQISKLNKSTFAVVGNIHDNPEFLEAG